MAEQGGKYILLKFKNGKTGESATFTATGDLVTIASHTYEEGDAISFSSITTTTTVSADTDYYVRNVSGNDFQLYTAKCGGTLVAIDADGSGTSQETYDLVGGLRSKSFSVNSEAIDVTSHDSCEWRKILDSAGVRTVSVSGSGVFEDGAIIKALRAAVMNNTNKDCRMIISEDGDYIEGAFKVTTFEQSGEYNAESAFSVSLASAGEVSYTEV